MTVALALLAIALLYVVDVYPLIKLWQEIQRDVAAGETDYPMRGWDVVT